MTEEFEDIPVPRESASERFARLAAERIRRRIVYVGPSESDADRIAYDWRYRLKQNARVFRRTVSAMGIQATVWVVVAITRKGRQ